MNQAFVKNDKQTVEQMLKAANTTVKASLYVVGEGIEKKADDFAAEVAAVAAAKQAAYGPPGRGCRRASTARPAGLSRIPSPVTLTIVRTRRTRPCPSQPTSASC